MPCTAWRPVAALDGDGKIGDFEDGVARITPLRHLGIERIAQAIAENVDGKDRERKADAGIDDVVRKQAEEPAGPRP